jgi:hypothetical protein
MRLANIMLLNHPSFFLQFNTFCTVDTANIALTKGTHRGQNDSIDRHLRLNRKGDGRTNHFLF